MKPRLLPSILLFGVITFPLLVTTKSAQSQEGADTALPKTGVVLTALSPPIYPPSARQAGIAGGVKIELRIRRDGVVDSAEVVSGHPMLKQSALASAQNSTFECRQCVGALIHYSLTYTFEIHGGCRFGPKCEAVASRAPEVMQLQNKITITVEPLCTCDPSGTRIKARSMKCLYLWKCGFRDAADE
jgi:TonB family protein